MENSRGQAERSPATRSPRLTGKNGSHPGGVRGFALRSSHPSRVRTTHHQFPGVARFALTPGYYLAPLRGEKLRNAKNPLARNLCDSYRLNHSPGAEESFADVLPQLTEKRMQPRCGMRIVSRKHESANQSGGCYDR